MAARKKDPAALRTLGLFSGKTVLEEAADVLYQDAEDLKSETARTQRTGHPFEMVHEAEKTAVRWLGLDAFHEGDDIKVAVHPAGHAVIILVRCTGTNPPYSVVQFKLSKAQWNKLKLLCRE